MRVIGTAGHVDHGKSTLVEALTGVHPDRLKEEQERQMTIDLGFAWLTLPGGEEVGIVDVPGHRDFIENMLAGVGGIDAALFVVAADEGLMPQTREHLAILDLLQIPGGVVALTKVDLVEDAEWLTLVEDELRQSLRGTILESAPVVRVSARTRQGIPALLQAIEDCLAKSPPRPDLGRPRLPVDRVFTMPGFGTVVTGTLSDGTLRVGDEVQLYPKGLHGRVRGLQTHKRKEETAVPGSRTAVNLAGIELQQVERGDVVARPGDYQPTQRMDVHFRLLSEATQPLAHNTTVKLFIGAAEIVARVRLLGVEALQPGEQGWLQLELSQPTLAVRGDHYILRRPSPGETLGGGIVVDAHPRDRHKRFDENILHRLEALAQGTPFEVFLQALLTSGVAPLREVMQRSGVEPSQAASVVIETLAAGQLIQLDNGNLADSSLVTSLAFWQRFSQDAVREIEHYHRTYPLRAGMPREEFKSRLKLSPRLFAACLHKLVADRMLEESGTLVRIPGHVVRFSPAQEKQVSNLMARFAATPYAPPTLKECQAEVGEEVTAALIETGQLVAVSAEIAFRKEDYAHMVAETRRLIEEKGSITAAEVRDHFSTSRRYALAFLEHLDASQITLREGDLRRLR